MLRDRFVRGAQSLVGSINLSLVSSSVWRPFSVRLLFPAPHRRRRRNLDRPNLRSKKGASKSWEPIIALSYLLVAALWSCGWAVVEIEASALDPHGDLTSSPNSAIRKETTFRFHLKNSKKMRSRLSSLISTQGENSQR